LRSADTTEVEPPVVVVQESAGRKLAGRQVDPARSRRLAKQNRRFAASDKQRVRTTVVVEIVDENAMCRRPWPGPGMGANRPARWFSYTESLTPQATIKSTPPLLSYDRLTSTIDRIAVT
jgi:hypothetical protein